ncbi:MAG: AraC family transcriptional regulator [Spirochaetota bacterium]
MEFPRVDFPRLTHFGYIETPGEMHAQPHYHYGYEVVCFSQGGGTVSIADDIRPFTVNEDDVLVTTPEFLHRFDYTPVKGRASYYWLGFQTGTSVARAISSSISPPSVYTSKPSDASYIEETAVGIDGIADGVRINRYALIDRMPEAAVVFDSIRDELVHTRTYAREMIHLKAVELFTLIYRRLAGEQPARDDAMSLLAAYMKKNYARAITLAELGEVSALNASYVSRRFKEVFGVSPIAYLTERRIAAAKRMLVLGKTAAETARLSGFTDVHYFRAVFKSVVGMTPIEYARSKSTFPVKTHSSGRK